MGLVNQVAPRDALTARVRAYAAELAELV
jgi:hypothetical protein